MTPVSAIPLASVTFIASDPYSFETVNKNKDGKDAKRGAKRDSEEDREEAKKWKEDPDKS